MSDTILGGDFTVFYEAENRQKRVKYTGSGSTYTANQLYSALQDLFDELNQMDDGIPISAQTPTEYTIGIIDAGDDDPWFIDFDSVEYLTGGALKTASWKRVQDSNTGIVKIIVDNDGGIVAGDIGEDIVHGDGDAGTLLDVKGTGAGSILWIRPDSDAAADNFDSDGGTLTCNTHTAVQTRRADTGELLWANIYSIGTIESYSHLYISQNDQLLTAYKGTSDWWAHGHIDILVQVKDMHPADSAEIDEGYIYVLARKYTGGYDYFAVNLSAGGRNPIPLATGADLDNTTGHRSMLLSGGSGNWNVGDRISSATSVLHGIITSISGANPTPTIRYFLAGDPIHDFISTDTVTNMDDTGVGTVNGAPIDYGPAALGTPPTFDFGADDTVDIDENGTAEPYSVVLDCNQNALTDVWEWLKYVTRRANTGDLDNGSPTQEIIGRFYRGEMLQIEYTGQSGAWQEGTWVFDQTTEAKGIVVADHDDGATGDLLLRMIRGTFTATNIIADTPDPAITLAAALQEDESVNSWVDETADAISAGGADVDPFPGTEAIDDAFYIGAAKMFSKVTIDIATAGTDGVGTWEYWDGTQWSSLESLTGFTDGTTDLKAAAGAHDLTFYPPADWKPTSVWNKGPYYYIRLRVTTVYTINPILDEVSLHENNTATIGSVRTVSPIKKCPFGNFAGGKFFGAPGVTLIDHKSTDLNNFQLVDDDGNVVEAPIKVTVEVLNTKEFDRIAVYRLTAALGNIKKDTYQVDTQTAIGDTTISVDPAIAATEPGKATGGVLILIDDNVEYRYRFASWAGDVFTLFQKAQDVAEALTSTTKIVATGGFVDCKVGDIIYNITRTAVTYIREIVDNDEVNVYPAVASQQSGDDFRVGAVVEVHEINDYIYVPLIHVHEITDGSESVSVVFSGDLPVRIRARQAGAIVPFEADSTIKDTGMSIAVIRVSDTIYT